MSPSAPHSVDGSGELPLRPVSDEAFAAVKAALSAQQLAACDDDMIRRFIRASDGKVAVATARIGATLEWRATHRPENVFCAACRHRPGSHFMHPVGFDLRGRPVIYSCLQLASNKNVEDNRRHMISTFERAVRLMPPGVEQWVWVSDFKGFGMADLNPAIAKSFLDMTANHYPERLGVFLLVDAPRMFSALWRCIAPLVDPVTKSKLKFVTYDVNDKKSRGAGLRAALSRYFDTELVEWLAREMEENRRKDISSSKRYSYEDLARMAEDAELWPDAHEGDEELMAEAGGADSPGSSGYSSSGASVVHDARGTRRYLEQLIAQPQLLHPQVAVRTA